MLRLIRNTTAIGGLIGLYLAQASTGKLLIQDRHKRTRFFTQNVTRYSNRALKVLGFEMEVVGLEQLALHERNYLFVSNHMSYVDVLAASSVVPSVFVTSVDMGQVFFLGQMAELGGSIFVERRHRGQIGQDISNLTRALAEGFNVLIYPEGTSTDGQMILPFKKSLLMSAVDGERDIVPVCTQYVEIDGEPFSQQNADKVCWYGDMSFAPHFVSLMATKKVKVRLSFLDPIKVTKESTRDELARKSFDAIAERYFEGREIPRMPPSSTDEAIRSAINRQA